MSNRQPDQRICQESTAGDGFWALYSHDAGPYLISAHPTEIDALRALNGLSYGYVAFVQWGENLQAADDRRMGITRDEKGFVVK